MLLLTSYMNKYILAFVIIKINIVVPTDCYNCKESVLSYNTLHNMLNVSQLHCLSFHHARIRIS